MRLHIVLIGNWPNGFTLMRVTYFTLQLQFTILHIKLNNTQFCQISESVKFWKIKSLSHFVEIRQKSNVSIDYCFILNKWTAVRVKLNCSLSSLFLIHLNIICSWSEDMPLHSNGLGLLCKNIGNRWKILKIYICRRET